MAILGYTQKPVLAPSGVKVGTVTIDATELQRIDGLTSNVQEQLNNKPNIADGVDPFVYVYSRAQADSIVPFTTPVQNNTAILHNGTGSLTTIFTGAIPANSITATGQFDILAIFAYTGTASKVIQVKLGSTAVIQTSPTTQPSGIYPQTIVNQNSLTNQIAGNLGAGWGSSSSAHQTFTFNTATEIPVTVAVNVPVGETATLLFLRVRAIKR